MHCRKDMESLLVGKGLIRFLAIVIVLVLLISQGEATNLPETGQKVCYVACGAPIPCPGSGQDGEFRAGVTWPEPRFKLNGACVTDNLTGLMWMKSPAGRYTWQTALAYASGRNDAGLCGYNSGWRLPNVLELESLINLGQPGSASWLTQGENGFVGILSGPYWSSTTAGSGAEKAWAVDFGTNSRDMTDKGLSLPAWPVRGTSVPPAQLWMTGQKESILAGDDGDLKEGEPWPTPRFYVLGDGTIRDTLTSLVWTADANTPGPSPCSPGVGKISYDAYLFTQCLNDNNYLGYSDWRIPNRREMGSLIDHSRWDPALPLEHPFGNVNSGFYWSSDTYVNQCNLQWAVDMKSGRANYFPKSTSTFSVWPVRGPLALEVSLAGDGEGTITGGQISCYGQRCLGVYNSGEEITITSETNPDAVFGGWAGCPSASGQDCAIAFSDDISMTASFVAARSIWQKSGTLSFGKIGAGILSPKKYISLKNSGSTSLDIRSIDVAGENTLDFTLEEDCTLQTLPPRRTCAIAVSAEASGFGVRRAEVVVSLSDEKTPVPRTKLKARAMPAKMVVSPKSLRFGQVAAGLEVPRELKIENRGLTVLTVSALQVLGDHKADFTIDPAHCATLQGGDTCLITVTFRPGSVGKRTADLVVTSDAGKKGTAKVQLKGEGVAMVSQGQ